MYVWLEDRAAGIEVLLQYGVLPELDVITRAARITNRGAGTVVLEKTASLSLDWQYNHFDWVTFSGRYAMERGVQRAALRQGAQSVGSVRGSSSHQCNPFSILCSPTANEVSGDCYGFSFLYSGEFLMEVEKDQFGQTRLVCGIHPDNFAWPLCEGESFQTPEVLMSYSGGGFGGLSHNLHRALREHVCRGVWKDRRRPVLLNNWEGTYFHFDGARLAAMARQAAEIGVELFVMDDGWFGKRDDDNSGLGDWYPNEKKLGCTLGELSRQVNEAGLMFGIWFEPERLSEDSDLYRAHPDWAVRIPGRSPTLSRNQLVLDISRREVQDYLLERLCAVLDQASISYVKWDMNRSICDKYSAALPAGRQGEFSHRYILGLYRGSGNAAPALSRTVDRGVQRGRRPLRRRYALLHPADLVQRQHRRHRPAGHPVWNILWISHVGGGSAYFGSAKSPDRPRHPVGNAGRGGHGRDLRVGAGPRRPE